MKNTQSKQEIKPDYIVIGILLIGAFVAFLSNTLLNIALPSIMNDFGISESTVQWLTTGYMLVNGIMIPSTAFLIQRYSARHLFLVAMTLFAAGTIIGGFAPSFALLLSGRMIQAAGSAIMMPLLMTVMMNSFPVEKRGSAMGMFGLVMVFAPAIGPTLSGYIIEHYEWPVLFHIIWPIALLVILISFLKLKDKKERIDIKIDIPSIIVSALGFGGILYGFSSAGNKGWSANEVVLSLIIGTISVVIFILRQFKLEKPMLDFRVYKHPMFSLSSAITVTINMAMFSGMLLMPIYLQMLRGISPLDSGLLMLPGALVMGIMSPITGKLFDRFGAKILAFVGITITVITTYLFTQLTFETTYTHLIILYTVRMFGMSMIMMPIMTNGMNQLPARLTPHGTAMNSTLNQVSGAIGSSLLITIMSIRRDNKLESLTAEAMSQTGGQLSEQAQMHLIGKATLEGINFSFLISTFILVLALVLAFFIKRSTPSEERYSDVQAMTKDV